LQQFFNASGITRKKWSYFYYNKYRYIVVDLKIHKFTLIFYILDIAKK